MNTSTNNQTTTKPLSSFEWTGFYDAVDQMILRFNASLHMMSNQFLGVEERGRTFNDEINFWAIDAIIREVGRIRSSLEELDSRVRAEKPRADDQRDEA
jgi:hypothetical protein